MSEYIVCPHCHNPLSQNEYVKVVRCRDCKHYKTGDAGSYCCNSITTLRNPDGYCAWGERRAEQ